MKKHFGSRIRILHHCMDQTMTNALAGMDLTAAQGQIMAYIAHCPTPPCARDIEEEFHLSHPTVSGILSRLEKKDFLVFRPDEKGRARPQGYASALHGKPRQCGYIRLRILRYQCCRR